MVIASDYSVAAPDSVAALTPPQIGLCRNGAHQCCSNTLRMTWSASWWTIGVRSREPIV